MRRRSDASAAPGLTGRQHEEIKQAVDRAVTRLLGAVPPFPLSQDEVEEFFMPRAQRTQFREAMKLIPDLSSSRAAVSLDVSVKDTGKEGGGETVQIYHLTAAVSRSSYGRSGRLDGFVVPTQPVEGHSPPPEYRQRLREWTLKRWKAGVEAGYVIALMEETFEICRTANQIFKVWPELLKISQEANAQALLSKVSGMTRAQTPDLWTAEHALGVRVANFILAKVALLPDYSGATGVDGAVCIAMSRKGPPPTAKFGGKIITPK